MSSKVYCIAQFLPKEGKEAALFKVLQDLEPNSTRENGCIQYTVTRQLVSPYAEGKSFPIAFNEIWASNAAFEQHCERAEIKHFFETQCIAETGLVADFNVCVYTDEPAHFAEL